MKKRSHEKDQLVEEFCDPQMLEGHSLRIPECTECQGQGNQNGVQISRVSDGWTWWCYRCERGGKVWDIGLGPANALARLRQVRGQVDKKWTRKCELPEDFTTEIPSDFLHWLLGYELDQRDVETYGMGYSPSQDRLIIPVYNSGIYSDKAATGRMIAYMGRSTNSLYEKVKDKWSLAREYGIKYIYYSLLVPGQKAMVLVEDQISAIKIHKAGFNVIALLTTYVPNELFLGLKSYDLKIWLDPNMVGKSYGYVQKFRSFGVSAQHVGYHTDPKDCPLTKIPNLIGV